MAGAPRQWTPLRGLMWGVAIAVVVGVLVGLLGVVTLWLFGDEIVARARYLRELRHTYPLAHRFRNYWIGVMFVPGFIGAVLAASWLDRWCALGRVIEVTLLVVGAAIGVGIMAAAAQSVVQPWDWVIWISILVCGVGMAFAGGFESWRRSEG